MNTKLFVIRAFQRELYWCNSAEHSCGWSVGYPKQSFSPSELTRQIRFLIDNGYFMHCEIIELKA